MLNFFRRNTVYRMCKNNAIARDNKEIVYTTVVKANNYDYKQKNLEDIKHNEHNWYIGSLLESHQ